MKIFFMLIALVLIIILIQRIKKSNVSLKKSFSKEIEQKQIDTTVDSPIGFGYKLKWFAIKTNDPVKLTELIGVKNIHRANWKTGISHAYENGVFITPNIDNWIIVAGIDLPDGDSKESIDIVKKMLIKLSKEFGEAQFFSTHRVVELHTWIKSTNGHIERVYSYVGERGENIIVEGTPTEIEKQFYLINTFSPESEQEGYYQKDNLVYPDEELIMKIAENWSINPSILDNRTDIKDFGLIGNWQTEK